jgi:hypothetical protein
MGNYSGHPRIRCPAMLLSSTGRFLLSLWLALAWRNDRSSLGEFQGYELGELDACVGNGV